MERPDDAAYRLRVETCALVRRLLPIAVLVGTLVGPLRYVDPGVATWLSPALFLGSLYVFWTVAGLPLYPAHTFGVEYRYEDEPLESALESERGRCVRCEAIVEEGTHRRYARQFVVLGVPIHTFAWGSNDFCPDCVPDPARAAGFERGRNSDADSSADAATDSAAGQDPSADEKPHPDDRGTAAGRDRDEPGTDIVRRVDLHDETTALEVERAFEDRSE